MLAGLAADQRVDAPAAGDPVVDPAAPQDFVDGEHVRQQHDAHSSDEPR